MKLRPIAVGTYKKVMDDYDEEDRKRIEVIRAIGKQRIQTSREQAAAMYAFCKALVTSGKLNSSNN
jgi:hypothetical protein